MPAGPVHYAAVQRHWPFVWSMCLCLLVVSLAVRGSFWWVVEFDVWVLFWYWAARYIDPDLDQNGTTEADGRMLRELDILGIFLSSYFTFYANLMNYIAKRFHIKGLFGAHQSVLTHSVVPGTLLRIGFLDYPMFSSLVLVQDGANYVLARFGIPGQVHFLAADLLVFFAAQFAALGYADSIHISLDRKFGDGGNNER